MNTQYIELTNEEFIQKMRNLYFVGLTPNVEVFRYDITPLNADWISNFGDSKLDGFFYVIQNADDPSMLPYATDANSFDIDDVNFDLDFMREEAQQEVK